MIRRPLPLLLVLAALAACGADGAPRPPADEEDARPAGGITISGSVSAGLAGGDV